MNFQFHKYRHCRRYGPMLIVDIINNIIGVILSILLPLEWYTGASLLQNVHLAGIDRKGNFCIKIFDWKIMISLNLNDTTGFLR